MANSSRRSTTWALFVAEIVLFGCAALLSYLSQKSMWVPFWVLVVLSTILFIGLQLVRIKPEIRDSLAFESRAAQMERSASKYGVTRFYNMQLHDEQAARNSETQAAISNAEAMWLCANSGASYLDPALYRHWPTVEQRLRHNVPFKVVLLAPSSREKALRNVISVGQEADDSKLNVANLIRLHNQYPSLEIRFVERGMYGTVFATPSCLFYDPYHLAVVNHRIENRSFCLKIERKVVPQGVGFYELFKSHFDSLWRMSTDFEEWVESNAEFYPNLPEIRRRHQRW